MEKSTIQQLVDETGCDEKLGRSLLIFTGGDIESAKKILQTVDKNIIAVKGKFALQNLKIYGLMLILYNMPSGGIETTLIFTGTNRDMLRIDLKSPVNQYKESISTVPLGDQKDEMAQHIQNLLNTDKYKEKLKSLLKDGNVHEDVLITFFTTILNEVSAEANIICKFDTELLDVFQMGQVISKAGGSSAGEAEVENTGETQQVPNRPEGASMIELECEPVYSPIKGQEVSLLKEGDYVKLRINDEREVAKYLTSLISSFTDRNDTDLLSAKIVGKEMMYDNLYKFTVEFGPGIYGRIVCGTDVKIESEFSPENIQAASRQVGGRKSGPKKRLNLSNLYIFLLIILVIFILILLIFNT